MSTLSKYLLEKYLKNFVIVLISLEIFFVGIDYLQNFKNIPESANLQLLYILYNAFFTLTLALPLSIVFAWIVTLVVFIKNNEFVAFNALGASRKDILSPIVFSALTLIFTLITLQTTPLAYSYDQKKKILDNEYFSSTKNDIFLKFDDYFVYFKKLLPLEQKAEDVHVFKIKDNELVETIIAKTGKFKDDKWEINDVKIVQKPSIIDINNSKLDIGYIDSLTILEGFKPKILNNVYENKSEYSLFDAISAWMILSKQEINTQKIRSIIYNQLFIPFFIFPILFLIYAYSSLNSRFFNLGKFVSSSVFGTLVVWGVFFMLYKLTNSGAIIPELSIILPLFMWFLFSTYFYFKKLRA
ncbi:lipooligosaccharide transport system, ABC transporter permease component LptG [Aliarcobacter faecis]|uniref:LptF/LptG family permease n=1 Tax=Aliarcobacter faecis TaxID=1564138 RepID=UPI00047B956B|nr:LptF/LptG family permease [Aliarcobacter faecis]QKF73733.1 lipooligosaccharide transport system, ABC transporter permease component LptG [Aliarcobacter faecis]